MNFNVLKQIEIFDFFEEIFKQLLISIGKPTHFGNKMCRNSGIFLLITKLGFMRHRDCP